MRNDKRRKKKRLEDLNIFEETARGNSETKGRFTSDEDNTSKILSSISLSCTHRNTKAKISFNCTFPIHYFNSHLPPT